MAIARKLATWTAIFVLGLLLGPLLLAAISGLTASSDDNTRWQSAHRVLGAFDERYPQMTLTSLEWRSAVSNCGYDFERLFGSATPPLPERQAWTPFAGYFDLTVWRGTVFNREVERRRTAHLAQRFSPVALGFLDRCMRQTAFAGLCGLRVRTALEDGDLLSDSSLPADGPRFDQRRETMTVCRYLDGLALRRGLPVAEPAHPGPGR
jgi:hypothetical protein